MTDVDGEVRRHSCTVFINGIAVETVRLELVSRLLADDVDVVVDLNPGCGIDEGFVGWPVAVQVGADSGTAAIDAVNRVLRFVRAADGRAVAATDQADDVLYAGGVQRVAGTRDLLLTRVSSPTGTEDIERDHYVPLTVRWADPAVASAWWGKDDPTGGHIEIKVDPFDGRIIGATVVTAPVAPTAGLGLIDLESISERGSVHVAMELWGPVRSESFVEWVQITGWLGSWAGLGVRYFCWEPELPARVVFQDTVGIAIGRSGIVVGLVERSR